MVRVDDMIFSNFKIKGYETINRYNYPTFSFVNKCAIL